MPTKSTQLENEVGVVTSVRDFLVTIEGLPSIQVNDIIESAEGNEYALGFVGSVDRDTVHVLLITKSEVKPGQLFRKIHKHLSINVSEAFFGRTIDPLGNPIDGKAPITKGKEEQSLDTVAPGIYARKFIDQQLHTGITLIDMLIPLGLGQRELLLGDARSGKTTFLVDLLINQRYNNTICIYASIGKPIADVKKMIEILTNHNAMQQTIIVATSSSDPAPLIYLTPKTAMSIAEYFQKQGKHVLVVLDDIGNHAKIYREISLLEGKTPGRESYPGDIFFQHSSLLERAGSFNEKYGGASITALPVIELTLNDFTGFIPTNVMSMTDGHLLFTSSLFNQGIRPSIEPSLSVSRVGLQTQDRLQNSIASKVKLLIAQASQIETLSGFGSELPIATQILLQQNTVVQELIRQDALTYIPKEVQMMLLCLPFTKLFKEKDKLFAKRNKKILIQTLLKDPTLQALAKALSSYKTAEELIAKLEEVVPILEKVCS